MMSEFVVEVVMTSRKMFDDDTVFSRREFKVVADPITHMLMIENMEERLGSMYKWVVDEARAKLKEQEKTA